MPATPVINGTAYAWGNVTLILFGKPVVGITKITYKSKQKKDNNYGLGVDPTSRGRGNKEYEGSITLYLDEWFRIIADSPTGDPLDIDPFDIPVVFGGSTLTARKDILRYVEFLENPMDTKQGDTNIPVEIPIIIGGIDRVV